MADRPLGQSFCAIAGVGASFATTRQHPVCLPDRSDPACPSMQPPRQRYITLTRARRCDKIEPMLEFADRAFSLGYGVANAMLIRFEYPAVICAIFLVLELALPHQKNSWSSYLRGARMVMVGLAINTFVLTILTMTSGIDQVAMGSKTEPPHKPLALLDLTPLTGSPDFWSRALGYAIATFGISCVADFFYYWMHRAQHRFGWFWRFHRVHHSITEMSATNSYHHVAEDMFQFACVTVPLSFLLGVESGPVPWLVIVTLSTHSYFIHSSANINIGPLRYVFYDNRLHRIHHSLEPRHRNMNFSTRTPLWDVLFGTAYFPKSKEWPAVGLADVSEPRTVGQYLMMPLYGADTARGPALQEPSRV
jgi:sterol desaturase/sphingolipid hydroxylase (fatty acid hydroxylase superfamily)